MPPRIIITVLALAAVVVALVFCNRRRNAFAPFDSVLAAIGATPAVRAAKGVGAAAGGGDAAAKAAVYPEVQFGGSGCGQVGYARDGTTPDEKKLVRYLAKTAGTFARYLAATYPNHPATGALLQRFSGEVLLSTKKQGVLHYQTGCVVVDASATTDRPTLVAKVLHLLAHTASTKHDALFFETHRWFLRIASAELGWDIPVGCAVCCKFQGKCRDACPACRWTEECAAPPATC